MTQQEYEQYLKDLKEKQDRHLASIQDRQVSNFKPCLHDQCPQCHGTGLTFYGPCVHGISCPCPKCTPTC